MKTTLFVFAASLLLLACSNDNENHQPEEQNTELIIRKFTTVRIDSIDNPSGDRTEYSFNEDGILAQKKIDEASSDYTEIIYYSYNQLGQLTESNRTFVGVNYNRNLAYFYDTANNLDYITESYDGATPVIYFELTHQPNKISIEYRSPGFYDYLYYSNNILTSIDRLGDLGAHSTENLVYDASNNILERPQVMFSGFYGDPETHVVNNYIYDEKINPLYPSYNTNPLNLLGQYWFNLDYWKPFLSPNNFISEIYTNTQDPDRNYTLSRTFQYNEDSYPISAIVKKDGVLSEELTYEYY